MRKIFSILLALALVLSVGLVTGIPVQANVTQPQVTVSTVRTGQVAKYTIVFTITSTLQISDSIRVRFPVGTTVPVSYANGDVTINANNVTSGDISGVGQNVTIVTSNPIGAGTVTVVFTTNAGITNPNTAADYTLWVNTSRPADQTPVESAEYPIRDLPAVTGVNPDNGNVGGTMWVVITGTSFMGDAADYNHSDTTFDFGMGVDVLQTKYISVNETNVQIEVVGEGGFTVRAETPAGNSTINGNFHANIAGTKQVDRWQNYTPSDSIFTANTLVFGATYTTIGTAVSGAGTGDTLIAHSGVYQEDLSINTVGLTFMSVSGKDATTIKGVSLSGGGSTNPNIDIRADGVKLHGFTIQGPEPSGTYFAAGMIIGAQDVEIYNNAFEVNSASDTVNFNDVSQGIVSYHKLAIPGVDVSGLNIHDNTFTHRGTGSVGYEGIYINRDEGADTVTIADNEFTGKVLRAITTERSNTVISDNTIITDLAPGLPGGYMGILVRDYYGAGQDTVSLVDNTVKGSSAGKGFIDGIVIGTASQNLTDISVTGNTVQDNETGILVRSSAGGVVVNYNNIADNIELGLNNTDSTRLDALYNWWGDAIGPNHDTRNPGGQLNAVTGNVSFSPWLYKPLEQFAHDAPCLAGSVVLANEATAVGNSSYAGGWNSFSTPVTLDGSANTVGGLLDLAAESDLYILRAQRFNPATQMWDIIILNNSVYGEDYQTQPGEGFYMQVRSKGSLPILVATSITSPTMRNLVAGWNLIGLSSLMEQTVADALSGVDYSMVLSPKPPNDTAWSVPPSGANVTSLQLGKAYWLAMAEPGILFGSTYTPVADDMTWDLNQ